jgi:hypothetical protein
MVVAPTIALVWMGCSSDNGTTGYGPIYVDPGGTYGAEVAVTVVGRGRVRTNANDIDCPSSCLGQYVFKDKSVDAAKGMVSLIAAPTPGSRFTGWSFSTDPSGTKGRGPDNCNPVTRPGTDPAGVDKSALEIQLPYGEVVGNPPDGGQSACSGKTTVPLVYNVTATFVTDPPPEIDSGYDAGAMETVLNLTTNYPGAIGREIGRMANGYLFWHFQVGGQSGIVYDSFPTASTVPHSWSPAVPLGNAITVFEVDPYGVAYQDVTGTVGVIRYGQTTPVILTSLPDSGTPPSCTALSVDSSYNVYCRTSSTLLEWVYSGTYMSAKVLYTGLPSGNDLLVESSGGSAYYSDSTSILSLELFSTDGGAASPITMVSGSGGSTKLKSNSSHFFWIDTSGYVKSSSGKFSGALPSDTSVPPSTLFKHLAQDQNNSSYYWVASNSAIYHAYYFGGTGPGATQAVRTGLGGIGGMTADYTYVYISMADGTVRRFSALGF